METNRTPADRDHHQRTRRLQWMIALAVVLIPVAQGLSQQKYEREYRINADVVPPDAASFLQACAFDRKIKWYREESLAATTIEAKVRRGKCRYSIEFDTLGKILDVEIEVDWEHISPDAQQAICARLDQAYLKYRIERVQLQWTGSRDQLIERVRTEQPPTDSGQTRYELIVETVTDADRNWYEILMSRAGTIERSSRIIFRNTDNLDYAP